MFALKPRFCFPTDSRQDCIGQPLRHAPALTSEAEAEAWLAMLPGHDAYAGLRDITAMLDALALAKALPLSTRTAVVRRLDGAAAPLADKLYVDYLAPLRGQATQEARLWLALTHYWHSVEKAYANLVDELLESEPDANSDWAALIGHALLALSEQAKLARMRYCAVDARIWRELGRLFSLAETAEAGVSVLVMHAWARLFMREMASPQNLLPRQIAIVDCLAAHYSALFVYQCSASPELGYYFDIQAGQAPSRRIPAGPLSAYSRFFGAGESYRQAELDARTIEQQGALDAFPAWINFTPDEVQEMLWHVARHWSPAPPARDQDRSEVLSRVMIVFDLNEIRREIAKGDSRAMLEATEATPDEHVLTESWVVRDESGGGFGADVPSPAGDWLCAGKLIGFKRDGGEQWGVGVIRRIEHGARRLSRVGIQILSERPRAIRLRPLSTAQLAAGDRLREAPSHEYRNGILLALPQDREVGMVLLPQGAYQQEQYFDWVDGASCDLMTVTARVTHTEEFDLLLFRLN